ncbi:MAG: hypothetical protein FJY29_12955 [Betaproteobacteria bacterium]|nr:hypothetical protein [Betaproteobacteria bacterium]
MSSNLNNNWHSATTYLGLALLACACSAAQEGSTSGEICSLTLRPSDESPATTDQKQLVYSGTLPEACLKKTSESSGRALVKLAAQVSSPSEQVALDELKAGQRALKFDASTDNLKRGTFEKSFDSTLLPEWSLPWNDRPSAITLSMRVPTSASSETVPDSISVELRF